jgi:hypothetical protein
MVIAGHGAFAAVCGPDCQVDRKPTKWARSRPQNKKEVWRMGVEAQGFLPRVWAEAQGGEDARKAQSATR